MHTNNNDHTGRAWTSDYGDPHNPHDFDFILPISPVHNVPSDRVLPPVIISTADREFWMSYASCEPTIKWLIR
jgi:prolyl oligopeptidase PreP (S9A serine peptidase family)